MMNRITRSFNILIFYILAKLLSPLSKSEYTVNSTNDFISRLKQKEIPVNMKLISFDVTSLFTNVPLDYTIDLILDRIYVRKELETSITKNELKELLILCTKNVHFTYRNEVYIQTDGVAMGSPLGPVLAGIFMVELEREILPELSTVMLPWFRYVDDTITYIKEEYIDHVLHKINNFHNNINFTYELEQNGGIAFLDVLIMKSANELKTTVYRKDKQRHISSLGVIRSKNMEKRHSKNTRNEGL